MQTLLIILLFMFLVLFGYLCYYVWYANKKYQREMSYDPSAYQGPAGEPAMARQTPRKG